MFLKCLLGEQNELVLGWRWRLNMQILLSWEATMHTGWKMANGPKLLGFK